MAGTITFTGMSSSTDFNGIIDALVTARQNAHIKPLQDWETDWKTKLQTISSIDSALSSFYTTVKGMDRPDEFFEWNATSSNTNALTASANSAATAGSHSITVHQLAQAATEFHSGIQNGIQFQSGVADKTASLNSSGSDKTFVYSYGGTTRTITVHDGDTLENLRDDINVDGGNPGVTAKIVTSGGMDHLVLVESTPNASKKIVIDLNGDMTLDGSNNTTDLTASTFTQTVNASGSDKVFQYKYGTSENIAITVSTGTTLEGLRDLINNDPSNPGVTAKILDDGGNGSGAKHLIISGKNMGANYAIVFNPGGGTTLNGANDTEDFSNAAGIFSETSTAQNAQISVDNYPPSGWIERSTNHITDVITGVTLNLIAPGTAQITISADNSAIIDKVTAFKDAFNSVRTAIKQATQYDPNTKQAGSLLGNYAVQIIQSRLNDLLSGTAPGFKNADDTYTNLQQLGFKTDVTEGSQTQGLLLLDTSALSNALNTDPQAVADLFSSYLNGISNDSQIAFQSALNSTSGGIYNVEVDLDPASENYKKGRFQSEGGDWHPWVDLEGTDGNYTLTGAAGYPEQGLALHITYTDGSDHTAQIRLKTGVVTQMSSELENLLSINGPLNTLDMSYNGIINNIDKRIAAEQASLDKYRTMLQERFARLDSYITHMNSMSSYLTMFASMSSTGSSTSSSTGSSTGA